MTKLPTIATLIAASALTAVANTSAAQTPTAAAPAAAAAPTPSKWGVEITGKDKQGNTITCVEMPGTPATDTAPALPANIFQQISKPAKTTLSVTEKAFKITEITGATGLSPGIPTSVTGKFFADGKAFATGPAGTPVDVARQEQNIVRQSPPAAACASVAAVFPPITEAQTSGGTASRLLGSLSKVVVVQKKDKAQWGEYDVVRTRYFSRVDFDALVKKEVGDGSGDVIAEDPKPTAPPAAAARPAPTAGKGSKAKAPKAAVRAPS